MKRLPLLILAGLFLLPTLGFAKAIPVTIPIYDQVAIDFFDACTGEFIHGTATLRGVLHFTSNASGGASLAINLTAAGSAIGETTGAQYIFHQSQQESSSVSDPFGQFEVTSALRSRVTAQGSLPNSWLRLQFHATFDAQGRLVNMRTSVADNSCFSE